MTKINKKGNLFDIDDPFINDAKEAEQNKKEIMNTLKAAEPKAQDKNKQGSAKASKTTTKTKAAADDDKSASLLIRLSANMRKDIRARAGSLDESMSSYILRLVEKDLSDHLIS